MAVLEPQALLGSPPPWPVCILKNGREGFGIEVLNQNFPSSSD